MTGWRQVVELAMTDEEIGGLTAIARSRSEATSRVKRAQMLLAYRQKPSFFAVGQELGQHHQTVQRCVERAPAYGPVAALDDRPRPVIRDIDGRILETPGEPASSPLKSERSAPRSPQTPPAATGISFRAA